MTNMNDLLNALQAANRAACDAADVARNARAVYDVAEARLRDANHAADLARRASDDYAREHGMG